MSSGTACLLDTKWENIQNVIKRAMIACENSGHSVEDDFPEVRKIVDAGITSKTVKGSNISKEKSKESYELFIPPMAQIGITKSM